MIEFIKKKYNILIPIFLIIVILIAVILYVREYRNNRYAEYKEVNVYQYFSGNKMEYVAKIGRNRKGVVLNFEAKDFTASLDSTPVYINKKDTTEVIFPKEMAMFFPIKNKVYQVDALSNLYIKNDLVYLRLKRLDKTFDHMFLYDGRDLYFFIDSTTLVVGTEEIPLSPMSYVSCSYTNMLEYYDKENDKYEIIPLTDERVYVKNDYMNIDVTLDKVIYKDSFYLLGGNFSNYQKITDIEEK
mgnify:CR=1 FL=1